MNRYLDFAQLVADNPNLSQFYDQKEQKYDFSTNDSLTALTQTLLKTKFGLDVDLSSDRLCPRLFNRLDYVDFMSNLLKGTALPTKDEEKYLGLDIGTGHVAIYPLLMVLRHTDLDVSFVATDIDPISVELATKNLQKNGLDSKVEVLEVSPEDNFYTAFVSELVMQQRTGFVMCNPPFYASETEMEARKLVKETQPRSELVATSSELVTPGGELRFVTDMIVQSTEIKSSKIRWFSSLLGKRETVVQLIDVLREYKVDNFGVYQFKSGSSSVATTRWILFWSFQPVRPPPSLFNTTGLVNPKVLYTAPCSVAAFEKLPERLQKELVCDFMEKKDGKVLFCCPGDVWSRSYRRQRNQKKQKLGDEIWIELTFQSPDSLHVVWKSGTEFKLFESFFNWLRRYVTT